MIKNVCKIAVPLFVALNLNSCTTYHEKVKEPVNQKLIASQNSFEGDNMLISTQDQDTVYNVELAGKARKLAGYVLNDPESQNFSHPHGTSASVKLRYNLFSLENGLEETVLYTVNVFNTNEQFILNEDGVDSINIYLSIPIEQTTEKVPNERETSLSDDGLDGKVNSGFEGVVTYSVGCGTPDGPVKVEKSLNFNNESKEENKEYFQQKYEKALDDLLKFYESKERR